MPTLPRGYRVYKAVNNLTGGVYIGTTKQLLSARVKGHREAAKCRPYTKTTKFSNAIAKYGFENFTFGELYLYDNQRDAWDMEIMLISELNPAYNVDIGGPGSRGNLGKRFSQETITKLSNAHKKKWKENPSQNSLDALNAGRERYAKEVGSKPVRLINDGRIFSSGKEAAKVLGLTGGMISSVLTGKRKSTHGMMFEFVKKGHLVGL